MKRSDGATGSEYRFQSVSRRGDSAAESNGGPSPGFTQAYARDAPSKPLACGSDDDSATTTAADTTSESPTDTTGGTTSENPADTTGQTRTVEADNGTIEVPADPQRVVTIGNTTLPFIDLGGAPVGVTEISAPELGLIPAEQPTEPFAPVVESNTWQALPNVQSGRALGVFCPGNNSYGPVLRYLDSLDTALASLPTDE